VSVHGRRSFEELVDEARVRLWRAFVPVRGVDGADDAVAEAMAWAWEHRERLLEMDNPVGYLYRVGITRSSPPRTPALPPPRHDRIPHVEPGLICALSRLSEPQRAAVWLVHGCQWRYGEVAEALDIGRSTVGTHVSRAMTKLRQELGVIIDD
jgi:DNA-directed RNA polymerase specialized sigma24 family protein